MKDPEVFFYSVYKSDLQCMVSLFCNDKDSF